MKKKVLVLTTSTRPGGNSDSLALAFAQGAQDAGHQVQTIHLREKNIAFCKGCQLCQKIGKCMTEDDVAGILDIMRESDVVVFATPIYFYEMSGRLKTFLDRTFPLYPTQYRFRDIYFLASAAEDNPAIMDRAISGLTGWIDCFGKSSLKGVVRACGVNDVGDTKDSPILAEAFAMGQKI